MQIYRFKFTVLDQLHRLLRPIKDFKSVLNSKNRNFHTGNCTLMQVA